MSLGMKIILLNPHVNPQHPLLKILQGKGHAVLLPMDAEEASQMLMLHGTSIDLAIVHREGEGTAMGGGPETRIVNRPAGMAGKNDESGFKFIAKFRADKTQADLPLIITSQVWGDAEFASHQDSPLGANAYLRWPFEPNALNELISAVFGETAGASVATVSGLSLSLGSMPITAPSAPVPSSTPESNTGSLSSAGLSHSGMVLEDASKLYGRPEAAADGGIASDSGIQLDAPEYEGSSIPTAAVPVGGLALVEPVLATAPPIVLEAPGIELNLDAEPGQDPLTATATLATATATLATATATLATATETVGEALGDIFELAPPGNEFETVESGDSEKTRVQPQNRPNEDYEAQATRVQIRPSESLDALAPIDDPFLGSPESEAQALEQAEELERVRQEASDAEERGPDSEETFEPEEEAQPTRIQIREDIRDEDAVQEMPYLFNAPSPNAGGVPDFGSLGRSTPGMFFAQPLGDAVVPGGAAHSPDVETLKKYLMLREQDVAVLSSQLRSSQEQIKTLESNVREEKGRNSELNHLAGERERKINEFEREKRQALESLQAEVAELKFQLKTRSDKARVLETQVREATEEMERLKERVRQDIRKIRVREKELENRLEIVKKDSEALMSARENKIIELKRKLDLLEFNMDLLQDQHAREKDNSTKLRERLAKAAQVVRVAGGLISGDGNGGSSGKSAGNDGGAIGNGEAA
jgi:hypothetical protein